MSSLPDASPLSHPDGVDIRQFLGTMRVKTPMDGKKESIKCETVVAFFQPQLRAAGMTANKMKSEERKAQEAK